MLVWRCYCPTGLFFSFGMPHALSLTTTGPAAKNQFLKCETIDKIKSNPIDD